MIKMKIGIFLKFKKGIILGCLILDSLIEVIEFGIFFNSFVFLNLRILYIVG